MEQATLHIITEIDLPEANVALMSDGIMYVLFKENCVLDIDLQIRLFAAYNEITKGKKVPFLFYAEDSVTITKEARENARIMEDQLPRKAAAVLATSLAYKLVANFYLQFNKPKIPYKVFTSKNTALEWLSQFLD